MKQMTCEMCGSTDLAKENGFVVCQSCGMKYSVEEAKKLIIEGSIEVHGTVKIDKSDEIDNWLKRITMLLAEGNWIDAIKYCEKVLEVDSENAKAYLGKLMAGLHAHTLEDLNGCAKPCVENNVNFQNTLRFCDDTLKNDLINCLNSITATWQYFESTFEYKKIPTTNEYTITELKDKKVKTVTIPHFVAKIEKAAFIPSRILEVYNLSPLTITKGSEDNGHVGYHALDIYTSSDRTSKILTTNDGFVFYVDDDFCYLVGSNTLNNSVVLPSSCNGKDYEIYEQAFIGCTDLTNVTISNGVTNIGDEAFFNCTNLKTVTIGNSVTSIGEAAFCYCSNLTSITLPNSVTSIGERAFYDCSSLTSITIPDSVTIIPDHAFKGCINLTLTIPNSVTSIGEDAFKGCDKFNGKDTIYSDALYCGKNGNLYHTLVKATSTSITSCTIHSDTKEINHSAFEDCQRLKSITIPASVTRIGDRTFFNCHKLQSVTIPQSVTNIGDCAFSGCKRLKSITIPNSVTSISKKAFSWCERLESIAIPDGVTSIGDSAFFDCKHLTSVTIPNSVTSIGDNAFCDCKHLTRVTIPNSVTSIGTDAFSFCERLNCITFKGAVAEWNAIKKGSLRYVGLRPHVICSDGRVDLKTR